MKREERIIHHLMLKSVELHDVSLYHGRMGIVLALYLYAQKKDDENIKCFAYDLLQTVYANSYDNRPCDIEWGLAGLGYGITLLKKYEIFDCDLNTVLSDIDQKIMAYDPRRMSDFSFRNGALGIYSYIMLRQDVENDISSFDPTYLHELEKRILNNPHINRESINKDLMSDLYAPKWNIKDYLDKRLGIDDGISYYLLSNCNNI